MARYSGTSIANTERSVMSPDRRVKPAQLSISPAPSTDQADDEDLPIAMRKLSRRSVV